MFPYFYLPQNSTTGETELFEDEEEVWNKLEKINNSGKGIPQNIHSVFNEIINKIYSNRGKDGYHPLDFPMVRYFLYPDCFGLNLPFVHHPNFIKDFLKRWSEKKIKQFFQEINAERPDHFYIRNYSLRAVWECVQFLDERQAKIIDFHSSTENGQGADIVFEWNNKKWHAEVKILSHIDLNFFCIAHVLAGVLCLKNEGKILRSFHNIRIDGDNINDEFRERMRL